MSLLQEKKKRKFAGLGVKFVRAYIEEYLFIRTKGGDLVKFKLNFTQRFIMDIIELLWSLKIPVRLIILKARQEGVSTLIQAVNFVLTVTRKRFLSLTVSYEDDSAKALYEISERFYLNLDEDMRPITQYQTKSSLVFKDKNNSENSLDSKIIIDTAKNQMAGRSLTVNSLHVSEMGFVDKGKKLLNSLLSSIPKGADSVNTLAVIESTANGTGNNFSTEWDRGSPIEDVIDGSWEKKKHSNFVKIFIPWFWDITYSAPAYRGFTPTDYFDATYGNETELMKAYKLNYNQLAWRRKTILSDCGGSLDIFKQEYPANDVEAFLASGRTRFEKTVMQEMLDKAKEPIAVGELRLIQDVTHAYEEYGGVAPEILFEKLTTGNFKIWEFPEEDAYYVCGGDVAEGIEVEEKDTDRSILQVFKRKPFMLVAEWAGRVEPDEFGDISYLIGWFYNVAWIGIERNKDGIAANKRLQKRYPRLYYTIEIDEKTDKKTKKFGWTTDKVTRPYMIAEFAALLRDKLVENPNAEAIKEYLTFIIKVNGRAEGQSGKHDDRVIASCIAFQTHKQMPITPKAKKTKPQSSFAYKH